MIESITLLSGQNVFTNKLYKHKSKPVTYHFCDSINIITGQNGQGKSVLLNIIAAKCGIVKGSSYAVMPSPMQAHIMFTKEWLSMEDLIENNIRNKAYPKVDIIWDGSIVHHLTEASFSPKNMWDAYDGDGFRPDKRKRTFQGIEILNRFMTHDSKGENATRILYSLNNLNDEYNPPIDPKRVNDVWVKADEIYQNWHKSKLKKGRPTLLIDELDSGLDIINQYYYWKFIEELAIKWQVIVVSHSLFAFKHKGYQIPLNKKYFKEVNKIKIQ